MNIEHNPVLCETTNQIQMTMVHFLRATLKTWWRGEVDYLPCSQLYYIPSGSAQLICNGGETVTMEGGHWYLLPTGTPVKYWCDDEMEEICFHFQLCSIDRVDLLEGNSGVYVLPIREDQTELFLRCLESQDPVDGLRIRQAVFAVLLSFIDTYGIKLKKSALSPCVSRAVAFIKENLSMQVTVGQIVQHAYVSKSTLETYFQSELGTSVHEYLYNAVMFEATQLLTKTELPVGKISELLGFCDQFYFSKRFKSRFGKSPKDFRNIMPM